MRTMQEEMDVNYRNRKIVRLYVETTGDYANRGNASLKPQGGNLALTHPATIEPFLSGI